MHCIQDGSPPHNAKDHSKFFNDRFGENGIDTYGPVFYLGLPKKTSLDDI